MSKLIDITGRVFGKLTVLSRSANYHGGARWLCSCECGKTTIVASQPLRSGRQVSCGCWSREQFSARLKNQQGENNPYWKGGRCRVAGGYIAILLPVHPNAGKNGYVLEHTLVMSKHHGRPLTKDETVHHRNGIKDDNRLENLELWCSRHPPGQRTEDKIAHAVEILNLYAPNLLTENTTKPAPVRNRISYL